MGEQVVHVIEGRRVGSAISRTVTSLFTVLMGTMIFATNASSGGADANRQAELLANAALRSRPRLIVALRHHKCWNRSECRFKREVTIPIARISELSNSSAYRHPK